MPDLDPFDWLFIALGLLVFLRVLWILKNSTSNLMPEQLPDIVRDTVKETLPGFHMESGSSVMDRKFIIKGNYRDRRGRVEVELDRKGEVEEFEYEEIQESLSSSHFTSCDSSVVPAAVNQTVEEMLGAGYKDFEPYGTSKGKMNGEACFKVKGRLSGWKWEFEVLENGRLIELEKERER